MKSKVIRNKDEGIVLSIGMIVKNEEKYLDKCLSALKNLTDHISSELIIVDTGSTDKTKEIALKYTDKVYDFEWVNDFSAARNYGLEKAKGKWFMFLDADDIFSDDCDQMIKFFSYPELYDNKRWNSGGYLSRNYSDVHLKNYSDFYNSRIIRMTPDVKFQGRIHEYLEMDGEFAFFDTVVYHYGYINTAETRAKYRERNLPMLLKEYEEHPDSIRVVSQLIDSADNKDKIKYVKIAEEFLENGKCKGLINDIIVKLMIFYESKNQHEKALEFADKFLKLEDNTDKISAVDVYMTQAKAYTAINDFESAVKAYENYLEIQRRYREKSLIMNDIRFFVLKYLGEKYLNEAKLDYAGVLCNVGKYEKARDVLDEFNVADMRLGDFKAWTGMYVKIFEKLKDYKKILKIYSDVLKTQDKDKIKLILQLLEGYHTKYSIERPAFRKVLAEKKDVGLYTQLMYISEKDENNEDIKDELLAFIDNVDDWKYGYSEAIYLCMKHKYDLSSVIPKMTGSIIQSLFGYITNVHEEYAKVAFDYFKEIDCTQSIQAILFKTYALEAAVLTSFVILHNDKLELFNMFIYTLSDYIFNIYNPELLNVEDADVLPELHRFGFYMTLAFTARNNGDNIGYIRCLKEALRLCEPMKDLVSFYLEEFQKELDN